MSETNGTEIQSIGSLIGEGGSALKEKIKQLQEQCKREDQTQSVRIPEQGHYEDESGRSRFKSSDYDLERAGLPKRLIMRPKAIEQKYLDRFSPWIEAWEVGEQKPDQGFFFSGNPELGESIMFHILKSVQERCFLVHWISALEFVDFCRTKPGLDHLRQVSLLGISNFWSDHKDKEGYCDSVFFKVLLSRYENSLPTIICSSESLVGLIAQLDHTISRLARLKLCLSFVQGAFRG